MIKNGAGVILVKEIDGTPKFLGLIATKEHQMKSGGIFDIPKGVADPGESFWKCAARECLEESGIKVRKSDILAGPFQVEWLTVWMCRTDQNVNITVNPHSGILEHHGFEWLDPSELNNFCYNYLKPFVEWASKEIEHVEEI